MKKLTLSVGLIAAMLSANAQDTLCTYFEGNDVYHFDFQADTIISVEKQSTKFYQINLKYGDVLCLDLADNKNRVRKVIITFFDGTKVEEVLDSKNNVYYSPMGATKIEIGKPKFAIKL